jgi:hypothetical protein
MGKNGNSAGSIAKSGTKNPPNWPSKTGNKSGGGRTSNPPKK